jgi:predicted nucleic acid-binding protein
MQKPHPNQDVIDSIRSYGSSNSFVSAIWIGEIQSGISRMPMSRRRMALELWLSALEAEYKDRVLAVDGPVAHIWGELAARARRVGQALSVPDGLIAATALHHGMYIVTRNVKDFEPTGVLLVNPWEAIDKDSD